MTDSTLSVHSHNEPLDDSLFQQICLSKSWGPLTVSVCIDILQIQATIDVSLYGTRIGGCTINAANPTCTVGGSVGVASAKAEITLDVQAQKLTYDVELCVLRKCKKAEGTLYSWKLFEPCSTDS